MSGGLDAPFGFPEEGEARISVKVLGSGTSSGVPTIGCTCAVCHSPDPRDNRLRPSVLVRYKDRNIVIDTTPDFRTQVLRAGIERLDAVIYTHAHADHILGLDDVRPFNFRQGHIPLYASEPTFAAIRRVFEYAFDDRPHTSYVPKLDVNFIGDEIFEVAGLPFQPIPVLHGKATVLGFRFGNVAYLTDHSEIPESSMEKLQGLDVLFLDALRHKPHPTHSTVATSIQTAQLLKPARTYFTHICHDISHAETEASLPRGIFLAYDGLEIHS
jgi:phosphoribosyl 1,2-cyclic phosphate phosphodiesterase